MGRGPSSIRCFMLLNIWGPIHGLAPPAANSEIPALALPGSRVRWGDSYPLEQGRAGEHLKIHRKWKQQCPVPARKGTPRPKCTPSMWGPSTLTLK